MLQWIELHLKRVGGSFSHMCSEILTGYTRVLFHPVSCGASFVSAPDCTSKLGPPAITWIVFWETSLRWSYAQSPAHLSVVQPALLLWLEE